MMLLYHPTLLFSFSHSARKMLQHLNLSFDTHVKGKLIMITGIA